MIRVEKLVAFTPGLEQLLFPHSAEAYLKAGEIQHKFLEQSVDARAIYYQDQLLCYAGVFRHNFTSTPLLWVLLGKNLTGWSARTFRKLLQELKQHFPGVCTVVQVTYPTAQRFAKVCGFVPLDKYVTIDEETFQFYEVQ